MFNRCAIRGDQIPQNSGAENSLIAVFLFFFLNGSFYPYGSYLILFLTCLQFPASNSQNAAQQNHCEEIKHLTLWNRKFRHSRMQNLCSERQDALVRKEQAYGDSSQFLFTSRFTTTDRYLEKKIRSDASV